MKDYDDNTLAEIEKRIKAQFDTIELEPAEETLAAIKPRLKKKGKNVFFNAHPVMTRIVATALSFFLFFGIGLAIWLSLSKPDNTKEYRYEDEVDVARKTCEKSDVTSHKGLFLPDLNMLINDENFHTEYWIGKHNESLETVYFIIDGINIDNDTMRHIYLIIILQKKYQLDKEEEYKSDNKITVSNIEISYLATGQIEHFYNYKIGFKIGDVRYFMDYQTTSSENDIESFMTLFLK